MNSYERLEDVIQDPVFPRVDQALRRGAHIDDEEVNEFLFLNHAQPFLEPFYLRYGADLVRATGGYFYLRPTGHILEKRRFPAGAMLAGQALALALLDPEATRQAGVIPRSQVYEMLQGVVGEDRLRRVFLKGRRTAVTERIAHERIRKGIDQGLRVLAKLGFITILEGERIRLRQPLARFVEPYKNWGDGREALSQLLAQGELELESEEAEELSFEADDEEES